jgi:hypothetical protein
MKAEKATTGQVTKTFISDNIHTKYYQLYITAKTSLKPTLWTFH